MFLTCLLGFLVIFVAVLAQNIVPFQDFEASLARLSWFSGLSRRCSHDAEIDDLPENAKKQSITFCAGLGFAWSACLGFLGKLGRWI